MGKKGKTGKKNRKLNSTKGKGNKEKRTKRTEREGKEKKEHNENENDSDEKILIPNLCPTLESVFLSQGLARNFYIFPVVLRPQYYGSKIINNERKGESRTIITTSRRPNAKKTCMYTDINANFPGLPRRKNCRVVFGKKRKNKRRIKV